MKRLLMLIMTLICMVSLAACNRDKKPNEKGQDYFNALVCEVHENNVIVECLDITTGAISTGTQLSVTTDVLSTNEVPPMEVGDEIRVVFTGVMETDPPQLETVFAIYLLDEEGNIIYFDNTDDSAQINSVDNTSVHAQGDLLYREFSSGVELEKDTDILIERKDVTNALENAISVGVVLNGKFYKEIPLEETDFEFVLEESGNYVFMAVNEDGETVDVTFTIRAEKSADGGVILLK